jgi:hypothetical protein
MDAVYKPEEHQHVTEAEAQNYPFFKPELADTSKPSVAGEASVAQIPTVDQHADADTIQKQIQLLKERKDRLSQIEELSRQQEQLEKMLASKRTGGTS